MGTNYASKVVKIAESEVGYIEKASNAYLDSKAANAGYANYNKYARDFDVKYPKWFNGPKNGYFWCDVFVDWCFLMAFGYNEALKLLHQPERSLGAGCTYSYAYFKKYNQVGSVPKIGAQIFFGYDEDNLQHTGIVKKFDNNFVWTVEGNSNDKVQECKYYRSYSYIYGYGYPTFDAEPKQQTQTTTQTQKTYKFKVNDKVIVSGNLYYKANDDKPVGTISNKTTYISRVAKDTKHPYNTSGDLGWMDEASIKLAPKDVKVGCTVTLKNPKSYEGISLACDSKDKFKVIEVVNDRVVITKGKYVFAAVKKSNCVVS